jgi:hypothetical protein
MSTIALALLLLVIILDIRRKKFKIMIYTKQSDKIIHTYRSNTIPDKDNVLMFNYGKEAYLVRQRMIRVKDDLIVLEVIDISKTE